jgi:DNA topoisomerase-2
VVRDFVNLSELNAWVATDDARGWRLKYYKGLGTWNNSDAKKLLAASKPIAFVDGPGTEDAMQLAFDAKMANARKEWILANVAAAPVPDYTKDMTVSQFVNTDLVNFSIYSVERALPSVVDGLKTSQRKILFTVLQRGYTSLAKEIKVAQLAGDVSHLTMYLHGEASLCGAIVNLAQDYCGSNNVNLLVPNGAFGTRLGNGSDSASPRYIYTYASELTRLLLHPADDPLLTLKTEEGSPVEPVAFYPILPLLLLNGCTAIATGFSTAIPMFNPRDVFGNVLRILGGQPPLPMTPWFRGFRGTVAPDGPGKWKVSGIVSKSTGDAFLITEVPPGTAFNKYAEWLQGDKSPAVLLENRSNESVPSFKVRFKQEPPADPLAALKLIDSVSCRNMYAFDERGSVRKYETAEDILVAWIPWRLAKYEERRVHVIKTADAQASLLRNKCRFVMAVATKKLLPQDYDEAGLCALLASKGFEKVSNTYDYLLSMQTRSFTKDRAEKLSREADEASRSAETARNTPAADMWLVDLRALATKAGGVFGLAAKGVEKQYTLKSGFLDDPHVFSFPEKNTHATILSLSICSPKHALLGVHALPRRAWSWRGLPGGGVGGVAEKNGKRTRHHPERHWGKHNARPRGWCRRPAGTRRLGLGTRPPGFLVPAGV